MARKKTSPDQANPLQRMFGAYLRVTRNHLDLPTRDASAALGLTETYYRLVEAGRAALAPSLSFRLIGLLANAKVRDGRPTPKIHFSRLALYLSGIHWVNAEMVRLAEENVDKNALASTAMSSLILQDADFEYFHTQTKRYYEFDEFEEKFRSFLDEIGAPSVGHFLETTEYVRATNDSVTEMVLPKSKLLEMPSLNAEMIVRLADDLAGRPFIHTPPLASAWEDRNSASIRSAQAIFGDPELILGDQNLKYFHYHYLRQPHFRTLRFIFLTASNIASLKDEFVKRLNGARAAAGHEPVEERYFQKIRILRPTLNQINTVKPLLSEMFTEVPGSFGGPRQYDCYWAFDLSLSTDCKVPISFVGRNESYGDEIYNLSLARSISKQQLFERIWRELEATSL